MIQQGCKCQGDAGEEEVAERVSVSFLRELSGMLRASWVKEGGLTQSVAQGGGNAGTSDKKGKFRGSSISL